MPLIKNDTVYDKRINKLAIFLYIIFFFSDDTYLFGTNSNGVFLTIARYIMIPFCIYMITRPEGGIDFDGDSAKWLAYITSVAVFIMASLANHELLNYMVIRVLVMTVGFLFATQYSFDDFAEAFERFVYFVCICSFPMTVLSFLAPKVIHFLPVVYARYSKAYTYGLCGIISEFDGTLIVRATGIFREPGVFQIFINVALMFELLYRKEIRCKLVWVYVITLLTTFSTAGYVVGILIFSVYCLFIPKEQGWKEHYLILFFVVAIPIVLFILFGENTALWQTVFGKVKDGVGSNGSMAVRLSGIITSIEIALDYPLHGIGIQSMSKYYLAYTTKSSFFKWGNDQYANTLFCQFSCHGIPFGTLFLVGTYKFRKWISENRIVGISIFLIIALLYMDEILQYSALPYIIMFYGYGFTDEYWKREEQKRIQWFEQDSRKY